MRLHTRKTAFPAIVLLLLSYLLIVVVQKSVLHRSQEFFPIFSWSLYSGPVDKRFFRKYYLTVTEIDGRALGPGERVYTVGTSGVRLEKVVARIKRDCSRFDLEGCHAKSVEWLAPFLQDVEVNKALTVVPSVCKISTKMYMELLRNGLSKYPKFVDCDESLELGPFTLTAE